MKQRVFTHAFVENAPDDLQDGVVYVSIPYAIVIHKCFCGCGREVATPLSPARWKLTFDGSTISLYPSIGNWELPCKSHYWLKAGHVLWAERWSEHQINQARRHADVELPDEIGSTAPTQPATLSWRRWLWQRAMEKIGLR